MKRRSFIATLFAILAAPFARAQKPARLLKIYPTETIAKAASFEAFRKEMLKQWTKGLPGASPSTDLQQINFSAGKIRQLDHFIDEEVRLAREAAGKMGFLP